MSDDPPSLEFPQGLTTDKKLTMALERLASAIFQLSFAKSRLQDQITERKRERIDRERERTELKDECTELKDELKSSQQLLDQYYRGLTGVRTACRRVVAVHAIPDSEICAPTNNEVIGS